MSAAPFGDQAHIIITVLNLAGNGPLLSQDTLIRGGGGSPGPAFSIRLIGKGDD